MERRKIHEKYGYTYNGRSHLDQGLLLVLYSEVSQERFGGPSGVPGMELCQKHARKVPYLLVRCFHIRVCLIHVLVILKPSGYYVHVTLNSEKNRRILICSGASPLDKVVARVTFAKQIHPAGISVLYLLLLPVSP